MMKSKSASKYRFGGASQNRAVVGVRPTRLASAILACGSNNRLP